MPDCVCVCNQAHGPFLQAVHGVVRHQTKGRSLSRGTGGGKHGIGGGVHILTVLHPLGTALPVDVEAGDTWVRGQNVPLKLCRETHVEPKDQHVFKAE